MIGQRYLDKKTAVINVWKRYKSFQIGTDDGVDQAFLERRAKALEVGQFVVAVVGETKAGKSSFINALLGERILPTDVLQSSSAIVEIIKSDRKYVKVLYADGNIRTVEDSVDNPDSSEVFDYLREIGSIQDRYRKIPTTLIDEYILQGHVADGQPIPFEELETGSKMRLKGHESLIEEYVKARTPAHIPVEITIGFPLKYAFDEFRLVDSPGVNAVGGVQDRTFAYLHNANAVLFIHSIEGPVENSSFREFVTHVIPNRTKQSLFLVLSKSGTKNKIEIDEKLGEARSLFCQEFDPNRILHADSMLKIMSEDILRFNTASDLEAHYDERKAHFEQLYEGERRQEWRDEVVNLTTKADLLTSVLKKVGKGAGHDAVRAEMRKLSNFDRLEQVLDDFSVRAPELQLSEILAAIRQGYEFQVSAHDNMIGLLNKKREHPQTFETELKNIKDVISAYQLSMNEFIERSKAEYSGAVAAYRSELEVLKSPHIQRVTGSTDRNAVRKALADFHDSNRNFIDNIAREVRNKFKVELTRLGEEFKSDHSITVPTVDIDGIEAKAKDAAYHNMEVPRDAEGFWEHAGRVASLGMWRPKETIQKLNESKFNSNFKSEASRTIEEVVGRDYELISDLLKNFIDDFNTSFQSVVNGQKKAFDELRGEKATNDKILSEIAAREKKKEDISNEMHWVNEMLGEFQ